MSRWLALILVAAFVLVGAGGFLLYDRLSSSAEMGRGRVLTDAAPLDATEPRQSPTTTASTNGAAGTPGWALNCKSQVTETQLECRMSQTMIMKQSRRVLARVTFRVPVETKKPEILLQLPLGLYIPAGATYRVDGGAPQSLDFRACDRKGCYAQTVLTPELLASLRSGSKLILGFQTLAQKPIQLSFSLGGFGETFAKIESRS